MVKCSGMVKIGRYSCFTLGLMAILIPLTFISISIAFSPWFSFLKNALSDLGCSSKSIVAPVFNFGLSTGGVFLLLFSMLCVYRIGRALGVSLLMSGYFLILIAVFDEVYGWIHYLVSIAFFLSLALGALFYMYTYRSLKAVLALIVGVLVWILYFMGMIKCGVAVPEKVSILVTLIWYVELLFKVSKIK